MKAAVLTITPNPSLDISGVVTRIKPNEKTYVQDEMRAPGGNAINVARILHRMNISVIASGFLGGSVGNEVSDLLSLEGVKHRFVRVKDATRINITVSNKSDHKQTRLSFSGPRIQKIEISKLQKSIQGQRAKILVIGGSLPPQFQVRDVRTLIKAAQMRRMSVVVDCPGNVMKELNATGLLLVKPNLEEFQVMIQSRVKSLPGVKKQALKLAHMSSYVCVSSVEGGALLVSPSGSYFGRIPSVKIKSSVGAGDSMVGAMVAKIYEGKYSDAEILRWGLAAAAATLSEPGTTLGQRAQIEDLYKKTVVKAI